MESDSAEPEEKPMQLATAIFSHDRPLWPQPLQAAEKMKLAFTGSPLLRAGSKPAKNGGEKVDHSMIRTSLCVVAAL
jgi:hypothetical protein